MSQITVPDVPMEVTYDVNATSTGPFVVPFSFFAQNDIRAEVTDAAGVKTTLFHILDFQLTLLNPPPAQEGTGWLSGEITLNVSIGADADTEIRIYRHMNMDRTANFPNSGPFTIPVLNDEQNRFVMALQSLATNFWQMLAGTVSRPSINVPEGVAPTKPIDGDIWLTATDFLARVNGVSYSLIAAAAGGGDVVKVGTPNPTEVGVWTGDGTLQGLSGLQFDGLELTIESAVARLMLSESGATADEGKWRIQADGDLLSLVAWNDAESIGVTVFSVSRTGTTVDLFNLVTGLSTVASNASRVGLNIPEGVAPTSPNDGDVWVTAAGEFMCRLNGVTVDLSAASGGDVSKVGTPINQQVGYWTGDGTLAGDTAWTFDPVTNVQFMTAGHFYAYDNVEIRIGTGEDMVIVSDGLDVTMTLGALSDFLLQGGSSQTDKIIEYTLDGGLDFYHNALLSLQAGGTGVWNHFPSFIKESAAPSVGAAAWGQCWVRNDAPCSLVFNDDSLVDHDLTGVNAARVQRKVKTANETVNNSSTPQVDDHLHTFALLANRRYKFEALLKVTCSNNAADMVVNLAFDTTPASGCKLASTNNGTTQTSDASVALETSQVSQIDSTGPNIILVKGFFETLGATDMDLTWAQNAATVVDTILWDGSYMTVELLD